MTSLAPEKALTKWIDNVLLTMAGLGAMQAYEERNEVCGVILVLDMASQHRHRWRRRRRHGSFITVDTVREMLRQTQYWASARDSSSIQKFLTRGIRKGDLEMVRLLLEHEVDIHRRIRGPSPLEEACVPYRPYDPEDEKKMLQLLIDYCITDELNDTSPEVGLGLLHRLTLRSDATNTLWLMESLIQRGVDINLLTRDKSAMSALAFHLEKRSLLCVELLLRHGADPCLGGHSQSPTALFIALRSDNVEFLRKVLSRSAQTPYVMDWEKPMDVYVRGLVEKPLKDANALHLASAMGSQACLEFLLEKNLIPVKASNSREGWTPLHISAFLGFLQEPELLISKGFHVMAENQLGQTPLHLAAQRAAVSIAKLLCKHGACESLDDFGKSPRDYAQERNLVALVNYFETCQDEVGDARHQSRKQRRRLEAALGQAIEGGDQEYCKKLLSRGCPINVILPGTGGCTPLMLALKLDRPNIAKWMMYRGASTLESVQNSDGTVTSIIEIAAAKPIFNSLLISIVGSYYWRDGDLVYGLDYPLHDAMWSGNIEGIDIILRTWEKLEQDELVKPYPDLNCGQTLQAIMNRRRQTQFRRTHTRETALHIASWKGDKVAASILVEHGAAIDSTAGRP
ncbi:hypothetical protein NW759_002945 [Fusarium solani]|nr:hypothetical protein NW759_002945 [Fusarium solani]